MVQGRLSRERQWVGPNSDQGPGVGDTVYMTLDSPSDLCDTMHFTDEEAEAQRSKVLPLAQAS